MTEKSKDYPWNLNPLEKVWRDKSEYSICKEFFQRAMEYRKVTNNKFIIYHIANESNEGRRAGYHRKCIGVWAGVYDYCVIWKGGYGYIEFKAKYNNETDAQVVFRSDLDAFGVRNAVARTPSQGMDILTNWIEGKDE